MSAGAWIMLIFATVILLGGSLFSIYLAIRK